MSALPSTWTTAPFKEVVSTLSTDGHVVETRDILQSGSLRVLTQGEPSADGYTVDTSRAYNHALPLIVFGDHTRAIKLSAEPFAVGPNAKVLATTNALDVKFLYYQLPTLLPPPRGYGRHFQFLAKSRIVIAPYLEQIRIVAAIEEHFSRLDAGVTALKRVQKKLERMRRAVLQTVFARHLADAPAVSLSEAASTQLGRMLSAGRETGEHSKPYLRNRDVQWGHVFTQDLPVMDFAGTDAERFRLNYGDVLICEGGEIGRAAVWTAPISECYFQKAVHRVRCSTALDPSFLRYLLEHYAKTRAFDRFASGSTIAHLPQEDLRRLPVPMPSVAEQRATVSAIELQFSALDHLSGGIASLIDRASALRASILATAFSGELVPQNDSEEPASVLLERIAEECASSNGHKPAKARSQRHRKVTT